MGHYRHEGSYAQRIELDRQIQGGGKFDTKLSFDYNRNQNENFNDGFNPAGQQNVARYNLTDGTSEAGRSTENSSQPLGDGHSFVTGWDIGHRCATKNIQRDASFSRRAAADSGLQQRRRLQTTLENPPRSHRTRWNVTKTGRYLGLRWKGSPPRAPAAISTA